MFSVELPLLVNCTFVVALLLPTSTLPNATLLGVNPTPGDVPVPDKATVWGLLLASSVIASVPVRVPVAVGVNVTLIVQLAPAKTEVPQVLIWEKSPLVEMLLMVSVALPLLVSV